MEENKNVLPDETPQEGAVKWKERRFKGNHLLWVILATLFGMIVSSVVGLTPLGILFKPLALRSPELAAVLDYTIQLGVIVVLVVILWVIPKNRFILRSFLPRGRGQAVAPRVVEDTYRPTQNNTVKMLLLGLLLGFVTNFFCIACALLHGDIKFYYDFSAAQVPLLLFALVSVFLQSTSEELWCRGFLYERILIHYPRWVAIAVNGLLFGLMHMANPGVSVLAIASIVLCGLSYSLVRWYTGSIWVAMGLHTMWNFTQAFLFGLPNSGIVSRLSVFHLDASTGVSNLIYDFAFGVEAALPALIADGALGVAVLLMARRDGRLGELKQSYETMAQQE